MKAQFYLLRPFTNLHVGSGETNFGVIYNLIERDAATGFPCVNSSGLKGAIKQMLHNSGISSATLKEIFGSDTEQNKGVAHNEKKYQQGKSNFLPARLLALPVRSDKTPFFLATCPQIIEAFLSLWTDVTNAQHPQYALLKTFSGLSPQNDQAYSFDDQFIGAELGAIDIRIISHNKTFNIEDLLKPFAKTKHPVCLISNEKMVELCNDMNLPVIARNVLEDGESQNLWYEQVLPRESLLYFVIMWHEGQDQDEDTEKIILDSPIQIGGNASVGDRKSVV